MPTSYRRKHQIIYETLAAEIGGGRLVPGQRLPTEVELVKQFQASRPTVTRAMQRLVADGFIERRTRAGTFVKKTSAPAPKLLGLIIPGLGETEIFEPICSQIAAEAAALHYALVWGHASVSRLAVPGGQPTTLAESYVNQRVAGVFFAPVELTADRTSVNQSVTAMLDEAGIPIVLLDRDVVPHPRRSRFDVVSIDHRRAAHILVADLLEQGERRIVFVARPLSAPTIGLRIAGYRDALREAGLDPRSRWVQFGDPADPAFVRRLLREGKDAAYVCGNDVTAAHLLHTLDELGISVPGDVRVAAFDDVRYARLLRVPLTTIRQPCQALGTMAMQAMRERIEHPGLPARDILLAADLVRRRSTQRPGSKAASPKGRDAPGDSRPTRVRT
jgi:GntR family transcriptional regulator of arabinose operon